MPDSAAYPIELGHETQLSWPQDDELPTVPSAEVRMSLVIGATASDGTVIVADTQETLRDPSGDTKEEHHVKAERLADDVIIGFAGAGRWAHDLVLRIKPRLRASITAEDAAEVVRSTIVQTDGFPEVSMMIAGTAPQPRLLYITKQGKPPNWTSVLHLQPPHHRSISCGATFLAKWLLRVFHDESMTVDQVAALCVACVLETSTISPVVSRDLMIVGLRSNGRWDDRDTERAKAVGSRFAEEIKSLRPSLRDPRTSS